MKAVEDARGAAELIEGARRDLAHAEQILANGGDRLLALVAVARAAKRADDATFALLREPAAKPQGDPEKVPGRGMS